MMHPATHLGWDRGGYQRTAPAPKSSMRDGLRLVWRQLNDNRYSSQIVSVSSSPMQRSQPHKMEPWVLRGFPGICLTEASFGLPLMPNVSTFDECHNFKTQEMKLWEWLRETANMFWTIHFAWWTFLTSEDTKSFHCNVSLTAINRFD